MIGVIGLEEKLRDPIDTRIRELKEEGLDKRDIVLTLYDEGYNTQEIMKQHLSLRYLRERKKATAERDAMATIAGPTMHACEGRDMAEGRSRRIRRRRRPFESAECRVCPLKGSAYCWRRCPYNLWRQRQIE